MKYRILISIDEELKNEAAEYIKTHESINSFSGLVVQSLQEYIHQGEKIQDALKETNIKLMLARQAFLACKNICEEMLEVYEGNQDKIDRWKKIVAQQEEIMESLSQD